MRSARFLGIDIGSSAVKAALFDGLGEQQAASRVACLSSGEIAPETWFKAVLEAIAMLDVDDVRAVGVCGRGGTAVLLEERGTPLAPSWDDGRANELARALDEPKLSRQARAVLGKARWWEAQHGPVTTAFSAKDYVVYRLTGALVTDAASGGGPGPGHAPLVEVSAPWGLAGGTQGDGLLPPRIPVAVGWHDGAAATFGAGASAKGLAPMTLGTNAVYRIVTEAIPPPLPKYWDLTPGLTVTGGDILAAGRAYAWAEALFPGAVPLRSAPGANGSVFLPQVLGRIAPDHNRNARGAWAGLTPDHTADDLMRAVIEGVAFSLRQVRDWLGEHGPHAERHAATGGGARNPVQMQILADILGVPIDVAACEEGCRGAALLGAVAAGTMTLEDARMLSPRYTTFTPDPTLGAAYDEAYSRFLAVQSATDRIAPRA